MSSSRITSTLGAPSGAFASGRVGSASDWSRTSTAASYGGRVPSKGRWVRSMVGSSGGDVLLAQRGTRRVADGRVGDGYSGQQLPRVVVGRGAEDSGRGPGLDDLAGAQH